MCSWRHVTECDILYKFIFLKKACGRNVGTSWINTFACFQTSKSYKWIQPQICREDLQGSVKLPKPDPPMDCPPCNPGQHFVNGSGCQFCPEKHYSDGKKPCQSCPASTSPIYDIDYKWWNTMPSNMSANCISMQGNDILSTFVTVASVLLALV